MLKLVGCLLALFFYSSVCANDLTLWQGVKTYHVDRANDEANNESNQITAVFYNRWLFSSFINSYSRRSELIGYNFWYWPYESERYFYHFGISIAAATGYGRELKSNIDGLVTIGVSPFAGIKYKLSKHWFVGTDLLYLPTDNGGVLVSGLNLTYRF